MKEMRSPWAVQATGGRVKVQIRGSEALPLVHSPPVALTLPAHKVAGLDVAHR